MDQYFGKYQTFETVSKKEASILLGADNLVGDDYEISLEFESGEHKAWLISRFDQRVGFFDSSFSRELSILKARGFVLRALLSFVAYSSEPEPGYYWGEMAVICYEPTRSEIFDTFVSNISERLQEGIRPQLDLGESAVEHIISSDGTWLPKETVPIPAKERGSAIIKSKRSFSEKMVEQGRARNKGCYAVSWIFIIVVVAIIVLVVLHFSGIF